MNWRERWRAWREEYDIDNPIAWLLGRTEWRQALDDERVQQLLQSLGAQGSGSDKVKRLTPEQEAALQAALGSWFRRKIVYTPGVGVGAFFTWLVAGFASLTAAANADTVTTLARTPPLNLLLMTLATIMALAHTVGTALALTLLNAVLIPTGGLYVGMARLRGAHMVYGVLVEQWRGSAPFMLVFSAPIIVLFGVAASGSIAQGLWYALLCALYALALAPSLATMGILSLLSSARGHTARSPIQWVGLGLLTLIAAVLFALLPVLASGDAIAIPRDPVEWLRQPVWWLSLIPPLLIPLSLWVEFHPLWGVPQIGLIAWLSWRYVQYAAVRMDEFRYLRETPQGKRSYEEASGEWG